MFTENIIIDNAEMADTVLDAVRNYDLCNKCQYIKTERTYPDSDTSTHVTLTFQSAVKSQFLVIQGVLKGIRAEKKRTERHRKLTQI